MESGHQFYLARLSGKDVPHPDAPQIGRYRLPAPRWTYSGNVNPGRTPKSHPVAIWRDDFTDAMMIRVGNGKDMHEGSEAFVDFTERAWPSCRPVPQEQYDAVVAGGSWPDEHEAVTRSNKAPPDESFEGLRDAIEDLAREADALIKAGAARTQTDSDRAADLANRLGELGKKADAARKVEKRPHDEAAKDVDRKWNPVVGAADIYKRLKAAVCAPFLEAQRRAAEEAKFQAMTTGTPEAAIPVAKATAGTRGRPVSLRTVKTAIIEDRAAVLAHFAEHEEIGALLQTLANRAVRAGFAVPGVKVNETQVAA